MAKDINKSEYTEETKLKLELIQKCFREWFPVFLNTPFIERIVIYDMFAGSGTDSIGNYGSPLLLLEEAKGYNKQYCNQIVTKNKPLVQFGFNEKLPKKAELLKKHVDSTLLQCKQHCTFKRCAFEGAIEVKSYDFCEIQSNSTVVNILSNSKYAKFLLLDQYGFKHISDNVFLHLINYPKTDFIFFIASSAIKRFRELPAVTAYFNRHQITFDEYQPKECHRVVTDYFRSLIPLEKEYYIHGFTIQKGSNYYGLIFGTGHSLGMEKFLKVCWNVDEMSGESDCNINDDWGTDTLFYDPKSSNKTLEYSDKIRELILNATIQNNIDGLKYALRCGCRPVLFVDVMNKLLAERKVRITDGKFNKTATNIHKAKRYTFEVV